MPTKLAKQLRVAISLLLICLVGVIGYLLFQGLSLSEAYQYLANPYLRYVRVEAGLRKEQVADIYGKVLAWNDQDKRDFTSNLEGYYFPQTYLVPFNATGKEVEEKMTAAFQTNLQKEAPVIAEKIINVDTAVKIASIIQREAAGPQDMNLVSGIIWNRIFAGMNLDIDATLQYAKGNDTNGWWPRVLATDRSINSPYNTYKNKGLPPSAISNPSLESLDAAFNPAKTNCLFYFHDNSRQIHCSLTYQEHEEKIGQYLGRR